MKQLIDLHDSDFPLDKVHISIPIPDTCKEEFGNIVHYLRKSLPKEITHRAIFQSIPTAHITFYYHGLINNKLELMELAHDTDSFFHNLKGIPIDITHADHFKQKIIFYKGSSPELNACNTKWHTEFPHYALPPYDFTIHITLARFNGTEKEFQYLFKYIPNVSWHFTITDVSIAALYRGKHQTPIIHFE